MKTWAYSNNSPEQTQRQHSQTKINRADSWHRCQSTDSCTFLEASWLKQLHVQLLPKLCHDSGLEEKAFKINLWWSSLHQVYQDFTKSAYRTRNPDRKRSSHLRFSLRMGVGKEVLAQNPEGEKLGGEFNAALTPV